jgi:hypothetical protein
MSLHYEVMLKLQLFPATGGWNDYMSALGIHNQQQVANLSNIF